MSTFFWINRHLQLFPNVRKSSDVQTARGTGAPPESRWDRISEKLTTLRRVD
jgi:hypothetical protein